MKFEIEILNKKTNPLIERSELEIRIDHFGEPSPNRLEIRKKIAGMEGADEKLTIVRNISSHFGASHSIGKVNIYKNGEDLKYFEPFHIQVRNLVKEKRSEIYKLRRKNEKYEHLFEYE
ncbi:MAG: 30S ribosomal protein S24e [Promethearchaeota archaeon]|nr:MAG: 30S ribosomal protein S24e [Candidatus Lokiarchaeota archaeon]